MKDGIKKVKGPFSRSWRPNFGFHLIFMSFHLEFSLFWVSRSFDLGDLRRGSGIFFKNQCVPTKKMRCVTALWSTFSLNLSIEEVCNEVNYAPTNLV